jgi:hypothetical protein
MCSSSLAGNDYLRGGFFIATTKCHQRHFVALYSPKCNKDKMIGKKVHKKNKSI